MSGLAAQMECAEFEDVLPFVHRLGVASGPHREAALAHAESCERCALLLLERLFEIQEQQGRAPRAHQ
jgi:hypothetical protein